MKHIGSLSNAIVRDILNSSVEKEINRITNRYIGRLLNRLSKKYDLDNNMCEAIKGQFRMMQGDVIDVYKELSDARGRLDQVKQKDT